MKAFIFACCLVPLLAAPQGGQRMPPQGGMNGMPRLTKEQQQLLEQGPPAECEKPLGEGTLVNGKSPYSFTVTTKQRDEATEYKKNFRGATIEMQINFAAPPGSKNIKGFALRAGSQFPVVQWLENNDNQVQVVSCLAPETRDTLIVKGQIGSKYTVAATPLLLAWQNKKSIPVGYQMAIQSTDGRIHIATLNSTLAVKETDYKIPEEFFRPPPGMAGNQGGMGPRQPREDFDFPEDF